MASNPASKRGPKAVGDILSELFAARGLGRLQAAGELQAAWVAAVGDAVARQTQIGTVRGGVLNVTVAHPALLEELATFRKAAILAALRRVAITATLLDLRFRVGPIAPAPTAT